MENNLPGIPKFLNFFNLRECLAVCFSKHESPFGHLAAWVRVKQIIKVEPEPGQSDGSSSSQIPLLQVAPAPKPVWGKGWRWPPAGVEDDRWVKRGEFDRKQEGWKMTAGWEGVGFAASSVSAHQHLKKLWSKHFLWRVWKRMTRDGDDAGKNVENHQI